MSFRPIILVDSQYDRGLNPAHNVSANEEATDFEAFRIVDGRRDESLWKPTTANAEAWIKVDRSVAKSHDMIVLDRGHNLTGFRIIQEDTSDDTRPAITQLTANSVIAAVSDGVDTRQLTIDGLDAGGAPQSEILTLNGTTEVVGLLTFSQIHLCTLSAADGARTVTVRQGAGGATRATLGPNVTATWDINFDLTIPTGASGTLSATTGLVTEETAWAKRYTSISARYSRLRIPAMGAGLVPNVAGLHLGLSFQLGGPVESGVAPRMNRTFFSEAQSQAGRVGRSRTFVRREGTLVIPADTQAEYTDTLEPQLEQLYRDQSAVAWILIDTTRQPQTFFQIINPADAFWGFSYGVQVAGGAWPHPVARMPYIENSAFIGVLV